MAPLKATMMRPRPPLFPYGILVVFVVQVVVKVENKSTTGHGCSKSVIGEKQTCSYSISGYSVFLMFSRRIHRGLRENKHNDNDITIHAISIYGEYQ